MDINKIRKDTPYCQDKIYVNSAGASLMPRVVVDAIKAFLDKEEQLGGYKVHALEADDINEFYIEGAKLLNCQPRNIAFAYNATDAYAKAISAIPFSKGDIILTTDDDYVSNYMAFISLKNRFGVQILRAKNLENGDLDLNNFEEQICQYNPKLVAITHIPTNSGLIQDVVGVGKLCKKYDVLYLLDACQSVGQMPVDVQEIGCDFLSVTGRKFLRGPRGTGLLYVSDSILNKGMGPLFLDAGGATWVSREVYDFHKEAKRFQLWENSYALVVGLKEALKYANEVGMENIYNHNQALLKKLHDGLSEISTVKLFDQGSKRANILTFRKGELRTTDIQKKLDDANIFYSFSGKNYALIDFQKKGVDWAVRLSPHYFNTIEEMEEIVKIVERL
jgi:selenocysteine lyase/cysteine desulfurase